MLNDRDPEEIPKSDEPETEYHFSDEDVSYELEDEETAAPQQQQTTAQPPQSFKNRFFSRLNTSKRMLITLAVFLVLIFVVYKMLAPAGTEPVTDIQPTPIAAAPAQPVAPTVATPSTPSQPVIQVAPTTPAATIPPPTQQPTPATTAAMPTAPTQPSVPLPPVAPVTATQPQVVQQPQVQPTGQVMPPESQITPPTVTQPVATMPPVMPVETAPVSAPQTQTVTTTETVTTPEAEQLIANLQAEYAQRLNEFANQNKNMGDEIQLLNSRVASLEAQINQLTQQLTESHRRTVVKQETTTTTVKNPPVDTTPHASYSVQAIIPGRAWLRADNGETVTVTEGDTVRDLGRITKIDPYDGIVEVNTGTKVISISYGTGT